MAQTYYSEYGAFSDYQEECLPESDINRCETERRYRWYQEESEGRYFLLNHNDVAYPYVDLSNYYIGEYSNWQEEVPANIEQREINTRYVYKVQKMRPVRYVYLTNLYGNHYYFRISELQILVNNQDINYSYYCVGCNSKFGDYIHNGRINENMSYVENWGYIRVDLGGYYDAKDIVIKLSLYDVGPENMNYTIKYTKDIDGPVYFERNFNELVISASLKEIFFRWIDISNFYLVNPEWEDPITYLDPPEKTYTTDIAAQIQYQYRDTYFYYYRLNKMYVDGYYLDYDSNYLKDINDYKDYYRCQKRDKVTIADSIIITDYNQSLDEFIYDNTTNNYEILGNVDFNTNGSYKVTFVFPFISLDKEIVVDIINNDIDILWSKINELQIKVEQLQQELTNQMIMNEDNINNIKLLFEKANDLLKQIISLDALLQQKDTEIINCINNNYNQKTINELLSDKEDIIKQLNLLTKQLDELIEEIKSYEDINNESLKKIEQINNTKKLLSSNINDMTAIIEEFSSKNPDNGSLDILLDDKERLEESFINLNNNFEEQLLTNNTNKETIDSLMEQLMVLKTNILDYDKTQIDAYLKKISELNSQIIKQNKELKDLVNLKKEEASKYENDILKLNELLKIKEDKIDKLMSNNDKPINNYNIPNIEIDYVLLIIITLISFLVVIIRFLYKKNVELK